MSKISAVVFLFVASMLLSQSALTDPQQKSNSSLSPDAETSKKLKALPTSSEKIRVLGKDAQKIMKRRQINELTISTVEDCTATITCPDGHEIKCSVEGAGTDCISGPLFVMCLTAPGPGSTTIECAVREPSSPQPSKFLTDVKALARSMRKQGVNVLSTSVGPDADCSASVKCAGGGTATCQAKGTSTECLDLGIGVFCISDDLIAGPGPKIDLCVPPPG